MPLQFPGVGEGPAGIRHGLGTSLFLERQNKTGVRAAREEVGIPGLHKRRQNATQ